MIKSQGNHNFSIHFKFPPLAFITHGLLITPIHLIGSMTLSLLSTCSWCVMSAYTWLSLWLSLSTCSWCVVSAYTWLVLWLSLSTCSWCVVSAYTWLALWLSLLSTCSWCVMSAYTWLSLWLSLSSPPVAGVWWEHTLDWLYDSLSPLHL